MELIHIHPSDNVAVALQDIPAGTELITDGISVKAQENIPRGHKIALKDISAGDSVIKYGNPIAIADKEIRKGTWVHTHNVHTGLSDGRRILL